MPGLCVPVPVGGGRRRRQNPDLRRSDLRFSPPDRGIAAKEATSAGETGESENAGLEAANAIAEVLDRLASQAAPRQRVVHARNMLCNIRETDAEPQKFRIFRWLETPGCEPRLEQDPLEFVPRVGVILLPRGGNGARRGAAKHESEAVLQKIGKNRFGIGRFHACGALAFRDALGRVPGRLI
jgi:hypothetical protein